MLITGIIKIKNNVRINLDDSRHIIVRYEVFLKSTLRKGDEIDESLITSLIEQNKYFWAKESAMRLLARRTHSTAELRRKLAQRKYEKEMIEGIIAELKEYNYLDDERFAREYYEEKVVKKGLGVNRLKQELAAKGVKKEIIGELLQENTSFDQSGQALAAAEKKYNSLRSRGYEPRKLRQSLYTFLISRGYDFETAKTAVSRILSHTDEEEADE